MGTRPFLIGLTGNIATGKSEVARLLGEMGAGVVDADQVAHDTMRPGGPAYGAVVEAFGPAILAADGHVDRTALGEIVFRDHVALERLEEIVHPAVIAEVDRRIDGAAEAVVVVEAIKLIEAGMHRGYDALWVVTAPRPVQIARLVADRALTAEDAALRVDAQPPQEEKAALAGRVIVNDGDRDALRRQVEAGWAEVQAALSRQGWTHAGRREGAFLSIREWISRHPRLTAWAVLAVGMVVILIWSARNVGLLAGQWAALIVATVLLAGLCVWIIGLDGQEEKPE